MRFIALSIREASSATKVTSKPKFNSDNSKVFIQSSSDWAARRLANSSWSTCS